MFMHREKFVHFKDRGDLWKDIEPLDIFDEKTNVFNIQYSQEYKEVLDYFRAVIKKKEISERVYDLTKEVILLNASNYMAWYIRRLCLDNIPSLKMEDELDWLDSIMLENHKNYQIWMHRKAIIDKMNDCSHEKDILKDVFDEDSKNFHAWTHKIWMIRRFNNTEGEFEVIEKMLEDDIKNNSVWNYRFFLVGFSKIGTETNKEKIKEIVNKEINYALKKILLTPINESAYSYIRGYLMKYDFKYSDFPQIKSNLLQLTKETEINFCLSMLLDIFEEEKNEEQCNKLIDELIILDYIRKKYWKWRKLQFKFK